MSDEVQVWDGDGNPPARETVESVVERTIAFLTAGDKAAIKAMNEKDLISLHHTLGRWIRNTFGFWREGGERILRDADRYFQGKKVTDNHNDIRGITHIKGGAVLHPDEASQIIIHEVWKELRK